MRELVFDLPGRRMAGLGFGEPGATPVLAIHGWLDNAASFIPLASRLADSNSSALDGVGLDRVGLDRVELDIVALDMAGCGLSDHRSPDGEYSIWNDLPDIEAVVEQLGWSKFILVGHSRGAIISSLYASARPERVMRFVLLDGLRPQPMSPEDIPAQLAKFLDDKARLQGREPREFETVDEALTVRRRFGFSGESGGEQIRLIVERNLVKTDGGWCWRFDPRLQGASSMKLTSAHCDAVLTGLSMPGLLLLAEQGLGQVKDLPALPDTLRVQRVAGGHHCHMAESVDAVAQYVIEFLSEGFQ